MSSMGRAFGMAFVSPPIARQTPSAWSASAFDGKSAFGPPATNCAA